MGEGEVGRERWLHGAIWRVHWGAEEVGARTRGEKIWEKREKGGLEIREVYRRSIVETAGKACHGGNSCEVGCAQGKKNGRAGSGVGRGRRAVSSNRQVKREHLGSIIKESACLQDASDLKVVESRDPGMGRQVGSSREGGDIRPCEYK